jgi:hypothetical protein
LGGLGLVVPTEAAESLSFKVFYNDFLLNDSFDSASFTTQQTLICNIDGEQSTITLVERRFVDASYAPSSQEEHTQPPKISSSYKPIKCFQAHVSTQSPAPLILLMRIVVKKRLSHSTHSSSVSVGSVGCVGVGATGVGAATAVGAATGCVGVAGVQSSPVFPLSSQMGVGLGSLLGSALGSTLGSALGSSL